MEMKENTEEGNPLNRNVTDVNSDSKESKRPFKYLLELLSDSVVTGLPQIVTVGSVVRRVFKILILGACFGGFIYQAVQFMNLYHTYPSQLEVELKYVKDVLFPVITICNRNPVQKTKYCNDFPESCAKPKNLTLFCSKYPHHCNQDTTLDDLQFVISDAPLYREGLEKYEQPVEDLICDCCLNFLTFKDFCQKMSKHVKYRNENLKKHTCYVVDFAKIGRRMQDPNVLTDILTTTAKENNCLLLSAFAHEAKYTIVLDLDPKEYTRPDRTVAAQVVVHSQSDFRNPFEKGFMAKEGKRYKVSLQAFEEHLLPAPYSNNCTENDKLDEDYDREFCLLNCTVYYLAEKCACVPSFYGLEIGVPDCGEILNTIACLQHENEEFCFQRCPRPCFSSYLQYSVSESEIENNVANVDLGDGAIYNDSFISEEEEVDAFGAFLNYIRKGKTVIDVVYDSKEITVYKYTPKYEKVEILGIIGGFIGIWLGISLVAVFDFLESILVFVVWLVHMTKKKRLNR